MPCPFEVFSYLYHHYPDNFAARFLGSEEASVDNAATCLRSASVAYASALCVCMCVFRCGTILSRSFWDSIPNNDPRKRQILEEVLPKKDDVLTEDELWARAVPIDIHGHCVNSS